MTNKIVIVSGSSAVGKTALLKHILPRIKEKKNPAICKIDCFYSEDHLAFQKLGVPSIKGLSQDICPDHFLVSNYMELIQWSNSQNSEILFIETAGLCSRCSPATEKSIQICVVDATASCKSPQKLGPMLTQADIIVLSKIDRISQAELEIILTLIENLNPLAELFPVDGNSGYGVELLVQHILEKPEVRSFEGDYLRHTMPAGVCSYCIGERRIGGDFQQGVVGKIDFGGER